MDPSGRIASVDNAAQMSSAPPHHRSIDPLTGLRFVAALTVFFSHYAVPGLTGTLHRMTLSGYAGVTIFFVLSGFVIGYNYLDSFEKALTPQTVGSYLVARFARIYPLYFCFILYGWMTKGAPSIPWAHLLAVQTWSPDAELAFSLNGPAWSVGVEVFLYLAFPLLVPLLSWCGVLSSLRRLQMAAVLVCVLMFAGAVYFTVSGLNALVPDDPASGHRWLYRMPATRLGDFLLGIFGATYFMRFAKGDPATVKRWGLVTFAAVITVLVLLATKKNYRSAFSWDVAYALPCALLIIGLAINRETIFSRVLASSPLILLGEASYAFYLVHVPAWPLRSSGVGGFAAEIGVYVAFLVLVVAVSLGLHLIIEKPAQTWIRRRLSPKVQPAGDGTGAPLSVPKP